jgi:hypothetical protein
MTRNRTCLLVVLAALAVAVLVLPASPAGAHTSPADLLVARHQSSGPLLSAPPSSRMLVAAAHAVAARVALAVPSHTLLAPRTIGSEPRSPYAPFLDRLRI